MIHLVALVPPGFPVIIKAGNGLCRCRRRGVDSSFRYCYVFEGFSARQSELTAYSKDIFHPHYE
ncbi:hypothetical protein [Coxiella endosymbiont of Amblyomma nuttalli]|uniref:hypothetical protein n=1 Tax=Coxiella endosymbiont of Amblyomma nuttalli TaxID=2749996 RepID=UPI001BAA59F9|nr:hypothetical protein [Coxiella endosymbiont of Amblyomma nuttalli]